MGRLFGTDGARGVANSELTCELAMNIGKAAAMVLTDSKDKHPKILIGKDTRISSDMLENALVAGLCSVGADVVLLGVVPTPAVAFLVKKYKADAGIMISASHNPFEFNGIKIFSGSGYKLPDALENEIEAIVLDGSEAYPCPTHDGIGSVTSLESGADDYIEHIKSTISSSLAGMKIAFDCSNGSASRTAEKLFTDLGIDCVMLNDAPNGKNINYNCGSTHMDKLAEYVKAHNDIDAGIAFDGDADRCLAVDENGNILDGDFIMSICAMDMRSRGLLSKETMVGTVMANMGVNRFCEDNNIGFVATSVGDRYVLEEMLAKGYNLGGEQSGHVIFLDYGTTGDGQLTAVQLLSIINRRKERFSAVRKIMKKYPQVLINIKVSQDGRARFNTDSDIAEKIESVKKLLGSSGRILVRVSGTEPLVRVMLEGESEQQIQQFAQETADLIKARLS